MKELTPQQLDQALEDEDLHFQYLYTPMCGTCQLAKRMLTIVEEAIPSLEVARTDLNYIPHYAKSWGIESVPCLIVFRNGEMKEKIYAFQSVDYLFRFFKEYLEN
ncbi:thioredoxin family protein [Bacillus tianshenii]|nr:thioredoxin family protein [Bacillus tianshenii]